LSSDVHGPTIDLQKQRTTEVDPTVQAESIGIKGVSVSKTDSSAVPCSWKFTSGRPSEKGPYSGDGTKVALQWRQGLKGDHTGDDRKFRAAVVLSRPTNTQINVRVKVHVQPRDWLHRKVKWTSKPEKMGCVQPKANLDAAALQEILDQLSDQVMKANHV
jgi:hypothetical protein